MMARFDIETFIEKFHTEFKTKLAAQIDAINTEKGDTLLAKIPNEAWLFNTLDDKAKNFVNFGFYYIEDVESQVNGPKVSEDYTIQYSLFIFDNKDGKLEKKTLRYWRALKDAVSDTWGKVGVGYDNATIKTLVPIDVALDWNAGEYHRVIAVNFNFAIG